MQKQLQTTPVADVKVDVAAAAIKHQSAAWIVSVWQSIMMRPSIIISSRHLPEHMANNRASVYYCHHVRVFRIGHLLIAAGVFIDGGHPNRSVSMIATNAAIYFERNSTVVHLNN